MSECAGENQEHNINEEEPLLLRYETVDSTNDELLRILRLRDLPNGTAVLAESQSRGKGRTGNAWHSPPKLGVYLSVFFRSENITNPLPQLTLVAGVSVCNTLKRIVGKTPELKWPNDIQYNRLKVGGILTEAQGRRGSIHNVVIGIGINISHRLEDFPFEIRPIATSITLSTGQAPDYFDLTNSLVEDLKNTVEHWRHEGFTELANTWKRNSSTIGRKVRHLTKNQTIEGEAIDLTEEGGLVIRTTKGEMIVETGEVQEF